MSPPSAGPIFAMTWPAVTVSPASTITCVNLRPSRSGRTVTSSCGCNDPNNSTTSSKHVRVARMTVTAAPFGASGLVRRLGNLRGRAGDAGKRDRDNKRRPCARRFGRQAARVRQHARHVLHGQPIMRRRKMCSVHPGRQLQCMIVRHLSMRHPMRPAFATAWGACTVSPSSRQRRISTAAIGRLNPFRVRSSIGAASKKSCTIP